MKHFLQILTVLVAVTLVVAATPAPAGPDVTATQHLFIMKEIKPDVQRVGIIIDAKAADQAAVSQELSRAGAAAGVKIFLAPVADIKDIAPKFRDLLRFNNIQVLWVVDASGIMANATARSFLIKNATQSHVPLFAPSAQWVNEGAAVTLKKEGGAIQLVVNKAAADALSLKIPEKYKERTQFLAAN